MATMSWAGLDVHARSTEAAAVDEAGAIIEEARLAGRPEALRRRLFAVDPLRIVQRLAPARRG